MEGKYHTSLRLKRPETTEERDAHSLIGLTYAVCTYRLRRGMPDMRKRRVWLRFSDSFALSRQGPMQKGSV